MALLNLLALLTVSDDGLPDGPDDVGEHQHTEVVQHDGLCVLGAKPLGEGAVADHGV